jgi:hypothetical protein
MEDKKVNIAFERKLQKEPVSEKLSDINSGRKTEIVSPHFTSFNSTSTRVIQNEVSRLQNFRKRNSTDLPSEIWLG